VSSEGGEGGWAAVLGLVSDGVLAAAQGVVAVAEVTQGGAGGALVEGNASSLGSAGEGGQVWHAEADEAAQADGRAQGRSNWSARGQGSGREEHGRLLWPLVVALACTLTQRGEARQAAVDASPWSQLTMLCRKAGPTQLQHAGWLCQVLGPGQVHALLTSGQPGWYHEHTQRTA
jgi:hypothetical protein